MNNSTIVHDSSRLTLIWIGGALHIHLCHLRVTQVPRSSKLAILVWTTTDIQPIALLLAHVHGVTMDGSVCLAHMLIMFSAADIMGLHHHPHHAYVNAYTCRFLFNLPMWDVLKVCD